MSVEKRCSDTSCGTSRNLPQDITLVNVKTHEHSIKNPCGLLFTHKKSVDGGAKKSAGIDVWVGRKREQRKKDNPRQE
ncbi:hypothetical protein V1477_010186, partial [Vespula maculifrons]